MHKTLPKIDCYFLKLGCKFKPAIISGWIIGLANVIIDDTVGIVIAMRNSKRMHLSTVNSIIKPAWISKNWIRKYKCVCQWILTSYCINHFQNEPGLTFLESLLNSCQDAYRKRSRIFSPVDSSNNSSSSSSMQPANPANPLQQDNTTNNGRIKWHVFMHFQSEMYAWVS